MVIKEDNMEQSGMKYSFRLSELIVKHILDDLCDEEQVELNSLIKENSAQHKLFNELTDHTHLRHVFDELNQYKKYLVK
jgi:hypothetical protein